MPKILIIYQSKTGNTKAMAEAVEKGVRKEGVEVTIKKIEDTHVDDLLAPDGIIIGSPTYFAADIAYHYNKFIERKFDKVINIWGADHQGHVPRMKAVISALSLSKDDMVVLAKDFDRELKNNQTLFHI